MTKVCVRDLPLLADVGINPDEIGRRQPLVITVELELETGQVEGIGETVDYRRIAASAENLATKHIPLIENFASRLCGDCISWPEVASVWVRIDKPFALERGLAGVEVAVRRDKAPKGASHQIRHR